MYDTVNMFLDAADINQSNWIDQVAKRLEDVTCHKAANGHERMTGYSDDYKVGLSGSGITLKGSLAKFFLPDNFHTLTRSDSSKAVEKLSSQLGLPVASAKITRLDLAQNFIMNHKPEAYYSSLIDCINYERWTRSHSLYFSNGNRTKLFYDKIRQGRKTKSKLPEVWRGQNVLRYEMRWTKRIAGQFNTKAVTAATLSNEKFYMEIVNRWLQEYEAITKTNKMNLNTDNINTPKDFLKMLEIIALQVIGQDEVFQMIEDLKQKERFANAGTYSRLKATLKELINHSDQTKESELIAELNKKIRAVKRYYR